jgi:hypothetical protein
MKISSIYIIGLSSDCRGGEIGLPSASMRHPKNRHQLTRVFALTISDSLEEQSGRRGGMSGNVEPGWAIHCTFQSY